MSLRIPSRWWWAIIGLAATVMLGGCSALRLAYGQAPNLAFWWLDGYVDFDGAQSTLAREAIDGYFVWHRRTQLPDYVQLLERAAAEAAADATPEQVCALWSTLAQRRDTALARLAQPAAALGLTLTAAQVRHAEQRLRDKNEEARSDFLGDGEADRARAALKRALERIENLYGPQQPAQREVVAGLLKRSPWNVHTFLSDRERRQQAMLGLLRQWAAARPAPEQATREMHALLQGLYQPHDDTARRYQAEVLAHNCAFAAQVHNQATPQQRRHLADKAKDWARDLRAVMASAGAPD